MHDSGNILGRMTEVVEILSDSFQSSSAPASYVLQQMHQSRVSSFKDRSWIDPDFREQSLSEQFVPTLIFWGIKKSSIPAALVT